MRCCTRPPTRSRASRTTTVRPAATSARAALSPASPAPTTTTSTVTRSAMPANYRARDPTVWAPSRTLGDPPGRDRRERTTMPSLPLQVAEQALLDERRSLTRDDVGAVG